MTFSKTSEQRLSTVHPHLAGIMYAAVADPDLATVVREAMDDDKLNVKFEVTSGMRTNHDQRLLFAKGRTTAALREFGILDIEGEPELKKVTWTLDSRHLKQKTGYGHAVDIVAIINGKPDWREELYPAFAAIILFHAKKAGLPVKWSGNWTKDVELVHFELPADYK